MITQAEGASLILATLAITLIIIGWYKGRAPRTRTGRWYGTLEKKD